LYNRIAGNSVDRIAALSDGVFAIAMTIIVLEIRVPMDMRIRTDADLFAAICEMSPRFVMYLMSFLTLGIFWTGQQTQLSRLEKANRDFSWIHIGFLAVICLMPFTTNLLAAFISFRVALIAYWLNILLAGLALYASWACAVKSGLAGEDLDPGITKAINRRILIAQVLYAVGAALCAINTYVSIGFIVLVQLNYAIAPRIRGIYEKV
jgi:uncharacterized membrane protein